MGLFRVVFRPVRPAVSILARPRQLSSKRPDSISVAGGDYTTDRWTNIPDNITTLVDRQLLAQPGHPLYITRQLIESCFPNYSCFGFPRAGQSGSTTQPNSKHEHARSRRQFSPVVSTEDNFDKLGFPDDHPGRSETDTYYVNSNLVLRTHTSAHQISSFSALPESSSDTGFLVSADVYRRDSIDRSHYPAFHQIEGAHVWNKFLPTSANLSPPLPSLAVSELADRIRVDTDSLPPVSSDVMVVSDPNPHSHPTENPLQSEHSGQDIVVDAVAAHLKRTLEGVMAKVMTAARQSQNLSAQSRELTQTGLAPSASLDKPIQARWIHTTFPFTTPSYELEVLWNGEWLEVLGCGVVKHDIMKKSNHPDRIGWAFGLGLERIAMLLFGIPDIRLFWSRDERFLSQFADGAIRPFKPFSKYPATKKDVAFWLASHTSVAHNDVTDLIRGVVGDLAENVECVDEYQDKKTGRSSRCYRITYCALDKTLTTEEAMASHSQIERELTNRFGVQIR